MSSRTVDLPSSASTSAAGADGFSRPNPVCTEIGVSVQGSSHARDSGHTSQPFLEQTTTVIIFAQGAVVRLSESVAPGQILIVRHLRTNDEAACRVVSVKTNPNVKGYVELEFLQSTPGFWGADLPAAAASSAKSPSAAAPTPHATMPAAPAAPAHNVVSDPSRTQTIPRHGSAPPATRSTVSPVDTTNTAAAAGLTFLPDLLDSLSLPTETKPRAPEAAAPRVDTLRTTPVPREVLKEVAPAKHTPAPRSSAPPAAAKTDAGKPTPAIGPDGKYVSDLLDTLTPIGETILREKPKSASSPAPAAPHVSRPAPAPPAPAKISSVSYVEPEIAESALPSIAHEPAPVAARSSAAHIAPASVSSEVAPLLSSSEVVSRGQLLGGDPSLEQASSGLPKPMRMLAIAATIAVVLAAGVGVYRLEKKSSPETNLAASAPPATAPTAGATPTDAPSATISTPTVTVTPTPDATTKNSHSSVQPNSSAPSTPASAPPAAAAAPKPTPSRDAAVANMKMAAPTAASRSTNTATPNIANDVPNAAQNASMGGVLGDGSSSGPAAPIPTRTSTGVQQPRLLNAPAPIYPYAARAEHIQGDVSVDMTIDSTGKVAAMTVLSGPTLLRQAALDALKQRKYAAAMLDGKPTSAHIVVIVHFQI